MHSFKPFSLPFRPKIVSLTCNFRLILGNVALDISMGTPCNFLQVSLVFFF